MSEIGFIKGPHSSNNMFSSKNFNVDTNHPLIPSSQEYMFYKKFVSIHSEDRDIVRYPNSAEFEIDIPQDLLNVAALRLVQWTFPANYNTFSDLNGNTSMTFKINNPYNPNINNVANNLIEKTYECLLYSKDENFSIRIEEGFYNPSQMVTELTNKFNYAVTYRLRKYFIAQSTNPAINKETQQEYLDALVELDTQGGYRNFVIVYNNVSLKIWFGNVCDSFILTTEVQVVKQLQLDGVYCQVKAQLPDFSDWGLPGNLGLSRCNSASINGSTAEIASEDYITFNGVVVPRFFYGDVFPGDDGFWLIPNAQLIGSQVEWVECDYKINLLGHAYMYMEIEGQNCIDETSPYNVSEYTVKTNNTNGIVNSAFAKMGIPTTPISQWFDRDSLPYKYYYPPAERMRRFKIRIRYHNGRVANFGVFNFSFVIEFTLQMPQMLRASNSVMYPPGLR